MKQQEMKSKFEEFKKLMDSHSKYDSLEDFIDANAKLDITLAEAKEFNQMWFLEFADKVNKRIKELEMIKNSNNENSSNPSLEECVNECEPSLDDIFDNIKKDKDIDNKSVLSFFNNARELRREMIAKEEENKKEKNINICIHIYEQ